MIFSIFQTMIRYFVLLFFLLCSLFGITVNSSSIIVSNDNIYNSSNISIVPISYDTDIVYSDDVGYNERKVVTHGSSGYALEDSGTVLIEPINEVIEVGRGNFDISYGSTTGYGADCVGCSGNVSCSTLSGNTHNLIRDGIYYNDSTYGNVRIVAADNSLFSCGTVMEIDNGILEPFMAIVMDTGSAMRNAWRNGDILIDIAFSYESSSDIDDATNRSGNVMFKVYRNGW